MDDAIVKLLLKRPALPYIREIRKEMDKDAQYLQREERAVGTNVRQLLSKSGVYWDDEIFQREWKNVVKEAVILLRTVEK